MIVWKVMNIQLLAFFGNMRETIYFPIAISFERYPTHVRVDLICYARLAIKMANSAVLSLHRNYQFDVSAFVPVLRKLSCPEAKFSNARPSRLHRRVSPIPSWTCGSETGANVSLLLFPHSHLGPLAALSHLTDTVPLSLKNRTDLTHTYPPFNAGQC